MFTRLQRWFRLAPVRPARPLRSASSLEALESRIAPAAVAVFSKGTLLLRGVFAEDLSIDQTVSMVNGVETVTTTVLEGTTPVGTGFVGVKNLVIKPAAGSVGNGFDLDLVRLSGNVQVFSAPDATVTTLTIGGETPLAGLPHIGLNVQLVGTAKSFDFMNLANVEIGGGVNLVGKKGSTAGFSNAFAMDGNTSIAKNLTATEVGSFAMAPGAEVGGSVLATQSSSLVTDSFIIGSGAKIGKHLSIYAGHSGSTINLYGEVGGKAFVSGGQGVNAFNVAVKAADLIYQGSNAGDNVTLFGSQITNSAKIILGNNDGSANNNLYFNIGPAGLYGDFVVGKNFSVYGGKGVDLVRLDNATYNLTVGGVATFSLGNGNNVFEWDGVSTGSKITLITGTGTDVTGFFGLVANNALVVANLGAGNDTLHLSAALKAVSANGGGDNDTVLLHGWVPVLNTVKSFEATQA